MNFINSAMEKHFLRVYTVFMQDVNTEDIKVEKKETWQDGTNSFEKYVALCHSPAIRK